MNVFLMKQLECMPRCFVGLCLGIALAASTSVLAADADAQKSISISGAVGAQYDNAVNTQPTGTSSGKGDHALLLDLGLEYKALEKSNLGIEFSYDFSQSVYDDLTSFNFQSHGISMFIETSQSGYDFNALYGYTRALLGGNDFLGIHIFQPSLGRLISMGSYVNVAYSFQNKDFVDANGRDANLHGGEITNFLFFNDNKTTLKFGYRLEHEKASESQFDYWGNFLKVGLKTLAPLPLITIPTIFKFDYQYDLKNFTSITSEINEKRRDRRHTLKAVLEFQLHERLYLDLKGEYHRAYSNLPSSDFAQQVYTIVFRGKY